MLILKRLASKKIIIIQITLFQPKSGIHMLTHPHGPLSLYVSNFNVIKPLSIIDISFKKVEINFSYNASLQVQSAHLNRLNWRQSHWPVSERDQPYYKLKRKACWCQILKFGLKTRFLLYFKYHFCKLVQEWNVFWVKSQRALSSFRFQDALWIRGHKRISNLPFTMSWYFRLRTTSTPHAHATIPPETTIATH